MKGLCEWRAKDVKDAFTLIVGSALDSGLHFVALTPEYLKHAKFCTSKTSATGGLKETLYYGVDV